MLRELLRKFVQNVRRWLRQARAWLREVQSSFAKGAEPENATPEDQPTEPMPIPAPQTLAEFIDVVKRTPRSVLSTRDRARIAAIMSFDERKIRDLMVPRSQMIFVKDTEILGPLVLDKLYKSGFTSFPVVDRTGKVLGIIHTEALNALEIKDTDRASKYLDSAVYYLHADDALQSAIDEIERTGSYYFLVNDRAGQLAGFFTIQMLLDYLTK